MPLCPYSLIPFPRHIKVANEWKVIRCIDAMLCLYDTACAPAWVDRVQITRLIAQIARADKGAEACVVRAHAAIGAFEGALADIDASASLYLTPASIMWDLDIRTKLVPRAVRSGCDGGLQGGIGPLLNFHHCASTWEATAERMGAITAYTRMEDTVRAEMRLLVANHGFIRERVDALCAVSPSAVNINAAQLVARQIQLRKAIKCVLRFSEMAED